MEPERGELADGNVVSYGAVGDAGADETLDRASDVLFGTVYVGALVQQMVELATLPKVGHADGMGNHG